MIDHTRSSAVALIAILVSCIAIEGVLLLADLGVFGPNRFRAFAYEYGGFWPGLLDDWRPNYAVQPYLMFLTYGFLHAGPLHLVVNMITLWSLGRVVLRRVGTRRFLMIYVASILGGAVVFGALAPSLRPMVGASGALFGLIGAIIAWEARDQMAIGRIPWSAYRMILLLLVLNVVLYWAMGGLLAWQTHLGGCLAGLALGTLFWSQVLLR